VQLYCFKAHLAPVASQLLLQYNADKPYQTRAGSALDRLRFLCSTLLEQEH